MAAKSLADKLKLKAGGRALILNAPEGYAEQLLAMLPAGFRPDTTLSGQYDWVQIFARDAAELGSIAAGAIRALNPESLLWVSFPKGSSGMQTDLTRDQGWDALKGADLKWVTLISIDDSWSAFCLRPYKPGEEKKSFR